MEQEKTLGERRVRISFNVSGDDMIAQIKKDTATLIDMCESLKATENEGGYEDLRRAEKFRLIALAQTAYEEAAMWAVKAATI